MKSNQTKPGDDAQDRTREVVDTILARLTQLQPTQELGQEDNGESGEFAHQALQNFRDGVAKTAKDTGLE